MICSLTVFCFSTKLGTSAAFVRRAGYWHAWQPQWGACEQDGGREDANGGEDGGGNADYIEGPRIPQYGDAGGDDSEDESRGHWDDRGKAQLRKTFC